MWSHLPLCAMQWIGDCLRWRGRILYGPHAHWCPDWDYLPIDETTSEADACCCDFTICGFSSSDY